MAHFKKPMHEAMLVANTAADMCRAHDLPAAAVGQVFRDIFSGNLPKQYVAAAVKTAELSMALPQRDAHRLFENLQREMDS